MLDLKKIVDIRIEGIDHSDYPDYCDAYLSEGNYPVVENPRDGFPEDWRELTEEELDDINTNHSDFVYGKTIEWIY